jgi:hypothetical protein
MLRKLWLVCMVLVLSFSFAACEEAPGEQAGLPTGEEVYANAVAAMADVQSYRFDMDLTMDMSGEMEGESIDYNISFSSEGAVDFVLEKIKMLMDMSMSMSMSGAGMDEGSYTMTLEMYLIDGMAYVNTDMLGIDSGWTKESASMDEWNEVDFAMSQMELLELAELDVTGVEKVNGVECYVVQVTPDLANLWQVAMQQADITGTGMFELPASVDLEQIIQDFSVKQWYAKDTYYMVKSAMDFSMYITPELVGEEGEGEVSASVNLGMNAYDYDEPVSIVLPEEAREAE